MAGGPALAITTGAEAIEWQYSLNTQVQSTYGGQVVQILSTFPGPITIRGRTANNQELKRIHDWFREVMSRAGYQRRDERAILFEYPERGWSFHIMVTDLPNFRYAYNEIAMPWSITAEIVSEKAIELLNQHTMSSFTDVLNLEYLQTMATSTTNAAQNAVSDYHNFSDNFGRLLGAWSSGDFAHWGFEATNDPTNQFDKTRKEYWMDIFGFEYLAAFAPGDTNSTEGALELAGGANPRTQIGLALMIKTHFESQDVPGRLGIAVALVESGYSSNYNNMKLDPNARQPGGDKAMGLFQTFARSAVDGGPGRGAETAHAQDIRNAEDNRSKPVTDYYSAQAQAEDASKWFKRRKPSSISYSDKNNNDKMAIWAKEAQGAGDPNYKDKIKQGLKKADDLLKQVERGEGIRDSIVSYAKTGLAKQGSTKYSRGGTRLQIPEEKGKSWSTDCSGWVTGLYYWGTNGNKQYNPNGAGVDWRSYGNTTTMKNASNGKDISKEQLRAGDLILYANHVNIVLEDYKGDKTQMAGFGSDPGPKQYDLNTSGWGPVQKYRSFLP